MVDYASDEEQVEALKRWWHENGRAVILGVVIALGVVGGWRGWAWYTDVRAGEAAAVYHEAIANLPEGGSEAVIEGAQTLREDFAGTSYATLGALAAARAMVAEEDHDAAAEWLQWAVDNAGEDELRQIARVRLARVLGESGELERALALVSGDAPAGWAAVQYETKGDLLAAQGDHAAAAEAYERALEGGADATNRQLLELKLNRARAGRSPDSGESVDS